MSHDVTILDQIQSLAKGGFDVFPIHEITNDGTCSCHRSNCPSPGKHPRTPNGFKNATRDVDIIQRWWTRAPHANVGIATTSTMFVVDVDSGKGGFESLAELQARFGDLPHTLTVRTGGGGRHFYFKAPEGANIHSSTSKLATGIDIRGEGGYVVAPPSNHKSGGTYEWVDADAPIVEAPAWLVELCNRGGKRRTLSADGAHQFLKPGSRNNDMASLAGYLRRQGASEEELIIMLGAVNAKLDDPLPDDEVRRVASSIAAYPATRVLARLTEREASEDLVASLAGKYVYCPQIGWLRYSGQRWAPVHADVEVQEEAKRFVEHIQSESERLLVDNSEDRKKLRAAVKGAQRRSFITNIVNLAKSSETIAVNMDSLDKQHHLLNLQNGTLDLNTLAVQPHNHEHLLTKVAGAAYDPGATCPRFDKFLAEVLPGALGPFMLRVTAYAMRGEPRHHVAFVAVGAGLNGKSTFFELMRELLGDYAVNTRAETFLRQPSGREKYELASLRGARLVNVPETPNGGIIDASLFKTFTGGDTITAREIRGEPFEFLPTAVLVMATNHLPVIDGGDGGMRRRLLIVPFDQRVVQVDPDLPDKLREEMPGVLNRLIEALAHYKADGLQVPQEVETATQDYLDESDVIGQFINEECVREPEAKVGASGLYQSYRAHCWLRGLKPLSQKGLKRELVNRGYLCDRAAAGMQWRGIRLKDLSERLNDAA